MKKTKIFISYSSKDRKTAEEIHQHLDHAGFDVWRDRTRLDTDWSREIAFALADSDALCLLWSEHSKESKWVQHEWLTARALEKRIILCLFPNAPNLPDPINNLHGVSFSSVDNDSKNLVEKIKAESSFKVDYDYTILPKNSYIPFRPNKHFTGRHTDLLELYLKMIGNLNKIGINQVGTVGMGGIGKTQLAVEFAFRFSYGFNAVYWIQAPNPSEWLGEFVSIARDRLKLEIKDPDKPGANKQYLYALQKDFKDHTGTLVIMDNIVEPKLLNNDAYLFGLTPLSLGCDLLFTTRKHFEIDGVLSQPVNVLSPDAAFELIKSYRYPETKEEEKHARSICNIVGYLPLAITLAGSYLRKYKDYFFADYREELVKKKLDTIDIGNASEEDLATRHLAAVTATLESQWEMLKDQNSRHLFKLAGQFPEAAIIPKARLHLLSGIKKGDSKLDRPFIKAYNYLQEICLVEQLEGEINSFKLHPLVREFSYNLVAENKRASFRNEAAHNLKIAYFDYRRLDEELQTRGVQQVIDDLQTDIDWWGKDNKNKRVTELLHNVMLLSSHVLLKDPSQLAAQLTGRFLNEKAPSIKSLISQARNAKKGLWIRPLTNSLFPSGGSLILTLTGHSGGVSAVVLTPDGKKIVSGSQDFTLKIWSLETGREIKTLKGHTREVNVVVVTPDGKKAVSGSRDGTLRLWSLETGSEIRSFKGHTDWIQTVAVTSDGRWVVSGARDNTLKVWDIETGSEIKTFKGHTDEINVVVVTPDGKKVVSASVDRSLKVWDIKTGKELRTLKGYSVSVVVTPDGKKIVSESEDNAIKIWDLETGREINTLKGHTRGVSFVTITPDGKKIISASYDWTIKIWSIETGKQIRTLKGHTSAISAVVVTPDGKKVVSASVDNTLKVWDVETGKDIRTLKGHTSTVDAVVVTPDGKQVVSASLDWNLKIWTLEASRKKMAFVGHSRTVYALVVTPDGKKVVSASGDNTLKIWDVETRKEIRTLKGHSNQVDAVVVTLNGKKLISASLDNTLKVWNIETGREIKTLMGHTNWVRTVAIAPNGKLIVSGSSDGNLKIWNIETGREIKTLIGHTSWIRTVAISPDGKLLVSGSRDGILKIWNLEKGVEIRTIKGHTREVTAVAVTPDGQSIISVSLDYTLKIWALVTGREIRTFKGHTREVRDMVVMQDGKQIISGSSDSTLKVWDIETGRVITSFYGDGEIFAVTITDDGKTIIAGDNLGCVHFLRLEGSSD